MHQQPNRAVFFLKQPSFLRPLKGFTILFVLPLFGIITRISLKSEKFDESTPLGPTCRLSRAAWELPVVKATRRSHHPSATPNLTQLSKHTLIIPFSKRSFRMYVFNCLTKQIGIGTFVDLSAIATLAFIVPQPPLLAYLMRKHLNDSIHSFTANIRECSSCILMQPNASGEATGRVIVSLWLD